MSEELKIRINTLTNKLINTSIFNIESNNQLSTIDSLLQECIESTVSDSSGNTIIDLIEGSINDSFKNESTLNNAMDAISSQLDMNDEAYQNMKNYVGSIINARLAAISNPNAFNPHIDEAIQHGDILASNIEAGIVQSLKDYTGYGKGILRTKQKSKKSVTFANDISEFNYEGSSFNDLLQYADKIEEKTNGELQGRLKLNSLDFKEPVAIALNLSETGPSKAAISSLKEFKGVSEIVQLQVDLMAPKKGFNTLDFSKYPSQTLTLSLSFSFLNNRNEELKGNNIRGKLPHSSVKKHFKNAKNGLVVSMESQNEIYSKTAGIVYDVTIQLLLKPQNAVNIYKFWISSILISLTQAPSRQLLQNQMIETKIESFNNRGSLISSDLSENDFHVIINEMIDNHQVFIEGLFSDFLKRVGVRKPEQTPASSSSDTRTASSSTSPTVPPLSLTSKSDLSSSETLTSPRTARGDELGTLSTVSTSGKNRTPGASIQKNSSYFGFILNLAQRNEKSARSSFGKTPMIDYFKIINTSLIPKDVTLDRVVNLSEIEQQGKYGYSLYNINFLSQDKKYRAGVKEKWKWVMLKKQKTVAVFPRNPNEVSLWNFRSGNSYNFDIELGIDGNSYYLKTSVFVPSGSDTGFSIFQFPFIKNKAISLVLSNGKLYSIVVQDIENQEDLASKSSAFSRTENNVTSILPYAMVVYDTRKDASIREIAEFFLKKLEKIPSTSTEETTPPIEEIKILHNATKYLSINFKNEMEKKEPDWEWRFFGMLENYENVLIVKPSEKNVKNFLIFDFKVEQPSQSTLNTWKINMDYPDASKSVNTGSFRIDFGVRFITVAAVLNDKVHFYVYLEQDSINRRVYYIKAIVFVFNKQFKHLPYLGEYPLIHGKTSTLVFREKTITPSSNPTSKFGPSYLNSVRIPEKPEKVTPVPQNQVSKAPELSESSSDESIDELASVQQPGPQDQGLVLSPPESVPGANSDNLSPSSSSSSVSSLSSSPSSSSSTQKSQTTTEILESQIVEVDSNSINEIQNEDENKNEIENEDEMIDFSRLSPDDIASFLY